MRTLLPALLLLATACGSGFEAGPLEHPAEDAATVSDAPRDTAPARDAGPETSPLDAAPVDATPVDAARLPDAAPETTTACEPATASTFTCIGPDNPPTITIPGSFCTIIVNPEFVRVLPTPPECQCHGTYNCACLVDSGMDLCGDGGTFVVCNEYNGKPEPTCE